MTVTSLDYAEKRYTSQDGLSLYYRDYGPSADGLTPVLCLPGLTRNSRDFSAISKRLMRERRVICPDFRGRGLSDHDPNWQNYEPTTYIGDIRHLLCALNIHRVFVIGTSMGGLLTMGMGAAMPTVLAGALINDVGADIGESGVEKIIDTGSEMVFDSPMGRLRALYLRWFFVVSFVQESLFWIL